ncbi:MAG TPA: hypothetical protein VHL34_21080, partial [Rhizomicrobium sp.]|nr:hypothetical protein [Rhizomicrobium sp.]
PCDAPFLPRNLVARLMAARVGEQPCAAEDASGFQGVCAVWPVACADRLRAGVESGAWRSLRDAMDALGGTRCLFDDADAFFNVNTREDLARAEQLRTLSPGRGRGPG